MSAHLICVTSGGGLPLFSRNKGNAENLPFSMIGSLNGVHMFGKSQNLVLLSTLMEDYTVVWKEFYDSVILIGIASGCNMEVLQKTLESVFNAMVLIVGIDEIKQQKNIERLKRELRVGYPVIDRLLDSLDIGDSVNKNSSDLVMLPECILCPENHLIQVVLDSYTECVDSVYSCILIHGKIAVATESWWSLHPDEIKLLSLLATAENTTTSKDIPVFLPRKSSNVAYRFVTVTLIPEVQVCCLCGPTPTLEEIEHSSAQCFKSSLETLNSAVHCHSKNFPLSLQLETGILGVLLLNTTTGKYMISRNPQQTTNKRATSGSHRLDILRTFYYQTVMNLLLPQQNEEVKENMELWLNESLYDTNTSKNTESKEAYWCSEYHKCHALRIGENIICILYNSSIPTHSMRLISQKTLKLIISDKQVCW